MDQFRLIFDISRSILGSDFNPDRMAEVLGNVGAHLDVSRAYVFLDDDEGRTTTCVAEWCAPGVLPQKDNLVGVPYDTISAWRDALAKGFICAPDIKTLPAEVRAILEPQEIVAIVAFPLVYRHRIAGFIGFDECRAPREWGPRELDLLHTVSLIVSLAYERQNADQALENFTTLFRKNPALMAISELPGGVFNDVNAAFCDKLGYRREEVLGRTAAELGIFRVPAQARLITELVAKFGRIAESEVQVARKDGEPISGLISGQVIERGGRRLLLSVLVDITAQKRVEAALHETERRLELAVTGTGAGLWDWDMRGGTVYYSPLWKRILGYREDEIGDSAEEWRSRWHPDDAPAIERAMDAYLKGETPTYEITHRLRHKDGSWRWILTRGGALLDKDGSPYRWVGTNLDVTEDKERSEELERFFSVNLDLLCIADVEGRFLKANQAWSDILGYSVGDLEGRRFLDFVHPDDVADTLEAMASLSSGAEVLNFVNRYRHVDGSYRYIEWRSHPYGRLIYAAARDITERLESENRLRELTIRDALTGVYNRRHVFERLSALVAESRRTGKDFSVAIVDLDRFKSVNDKYGHLAGDAVLRAFSESIGGELRPYDLLGRYGGEEFIVVFPNAALCDAGSILERMRTGFQDLVLPVEGVELRCTFSGGVACSSEFDDRSLSAESLVEQADRRLYAAKGAGRNCIVSGGECAP